MELPDEEKERKGTHASTRWLAEKVHVWYSGCECSLASASRADPEGLSFVQGLSNPFCARVVHGDDFMVEMPTHEEKRFGSVLFSKYDGKCTEKHHPDGNTAMEAS